MEQEYKFKTDYLGRLEGETFITEAKSLSWDYQGARIEIPITHGALEEITSPVIYNTNEDEVYLIHDINTDLKRKETYYRGCRHLLQYEGTNQVTRLDVTNHREFEYFVGAKDSVRFKTRQSWDDYVKLQQAIKDSGLKIGDDVGELSNLNAYFVTFDKGVAVGVRFHSWDHEDSRVATGFKIVDGYPCVSVDQCYVDNYVWFKIADLKPSTKKHFKFGGKDVSIELASAGKEVIITAEGAQETYTSAKKLVDAINTIKGWRFGSHEVKYRNDKQDTNVTIGCTTGKLSEIEAILAGCEDLLAKK